MRQRFNGNTTDRKLRGKRMNHRRFFSPIVLGIILLTGCNGSPGPAATHPPSDSNVPASAAEPQTLQIQGTVVHKGIEGGFYAIDADDGSKFNPLNLPETYHKDGLRVRLTARPRGDAMSIHMYGGMIEILEIEAQ